MDRSQYFEAGASSRNSGPITLDQMLELQRNVDNIPEDASITVQDSADKILAFFVSSDEDERLSVADADVLISDGGTPISFSGLDTLLAIDDFDAGASTLAVSASAAEIQGRISSDLQQLLDLQITLNVSDMDTEQVTLNVAELSGLGVKFVEAHHSVNLVDSVSAITGYGGAIDVNRVTFEAESDGQDLSGLDIDSFDGEQSTILSLAGYDEIELSASQIPVQVVGEGSYNISGTGAELSTLISGAAGETLTNLVGASGLILDSGDLTVPVTVYAQYHDKIDIGDYGSLSITGTPAEFNTYNTADPANPALPATATVTATLDAAFDFAGVDLAGVDSIDLGTFDGSNLSVAQADIVVAGTGTYTVVDTAGAIEAEVTDTTAGSVDGATSVATPAGGEVMDTVTLTVAEYFQLVDGDTTLTTPHRIVDTAANIQGETVEDDWFSLGKGATAGAVSVESSDGTLTFSVAQVKALNASPSTNIVGGYDIVDGAGEIHQAIGEGEEWILTEAGTVTVDGGTVELNVNSVPEYRVRKPRGHQGLRDRRQCVQYRHGHH